jgi:hypothetical protein
MGATNLTIAKELCIIEKQVERVVEVVRLHRPGLRSHRRQVIRSCTASSRQGRHGRPHATDHGTP